VASSDEKAKPDAKGGQQAPRVPDTIPDAKTKPLTHDGDRSDQERR
jgi:hypothetical protein